MTNNQVGGMPDHDDLGIVLDFVQKLHSQPGFREEAKLFLRGKCVFPEEMRLERPFPKLEKMLSKRFEKPIIVDSYPAMFTPEFLARMAQYNLKPVFLPGEEIAEDTRLKRWVKPNDWFYRMVAEDKIKPYENLAPTLLRRGWYLADFTVGADYADGTQVFVNDPWASLITRLRQEGKVGKYDQTPLGSRFVITHQEWEEVLIPEMTEEPELKKAAAIIRLERAIEANAIGNLYDRNRGRFNMWEWFADRFGDSYRLFGGSRDRGGLAGAHYDWSAFRNGYIAGRPLVCFVS